MPKKTTTDEIDPLATLTKRQREIFDYFTSNPRATYTEMGAALGCSHQAISEQMRKPALAKAVNAFLDAELETMYRRARSLAPAMVDVLREVAMGQTWEETREKTSAAKSDDGEEGIGEIVERTLTVKAPGPGARTNAAWKAIQIAERAAAAAKIASDAPPTEKRKKVKGLVMLIGPRPKKATQ